MSCPTFKTTEVAQLYEEIRLWAHPDFPFLDANYSPNSRMPAIDFTPYVAAWLEAGKEEAIVEFWTWLTADRPAELAAIRSALTARLPVWIGLSSKAKHELHATYILTLRAAWGRTPNIGNIGATVAATTLACRQLTLPPDSDGRASGCMHIEGADAKPLAQGAAYSEDLLKVIRSEVHETHTGAQNGRSEGARLALEKLMSPLETAEAAAEKLKCVPPMVRRVVHTLCNGGRVSGVMQLDLGYNERVYGCSRQANRQYLDWLGFFASPTDDATVPPILTKDILSEALACRGIQSKKSASRAVMIEQARSVSGLLSSLISKHCPEQCDVLPEWVEPLREWSLRVDYAAPVAAALIKILGVSTIRKRR